MMTAQEFLAGLEAIPWFERLGQPSSRDHEVFRIYDWGVWPGPENPGSEIQQAYHMLWRDSLIETADSAIKDDLELLWNTINEKVLSIASLRVPYDDGEDAWYGPNAAVWSASWIAALVGCTIARHGDLRSGEDATVQWTLHNEWSWYRNGHWPCTYYWSWGYTDIEAVERTKVTKRIVVY
jgi:hypothetical protein